MTTTHEQLARAAARAIIDDYPRPDLGRQAADALEHAAAGQSDDIATSCRELTAVAQDATGDLHLRLIHHPNGAPDPEDESAYVEHYAAESAKSAGGIRSVTRTADNICILDLGPVLWPPMHGEQWQSAALRLALGADAVVLDLRRCLGGSPESTVLLCNHLFGPEPVHLIDVVSRKSTDEFWTQPVDEPTVGPDVPLRLLVSGDTFSGGEEIAFDLQELGRARVIGERTRGGAHPRIGVRIHPEVELALPIAVPRSPRTGRNWEGVGVQPDAVVPAETALDVALAELHSQLSVKRPSA